MRFRKGHHHIFRGTVQGRNNKGRYTVHFDDNDETDASPNQIRPLCAESLLPPKTLPDYQVKKARSLLDSMDIMSLEEEVRHRVYAEVIVLLGIRHFSSPLTTGANIKVLLDLCQAIKANKVDRLERLILDDQMDVNAPLLSLSSQSGLTNILPLHYATQRGVEDVVRLLLKHDADVNGKDGKGR